ncbi:hypothetical protein HDV00_007628 [Rhizophlyctis rosea]|nr:hypothetical protein HDV00_007628 [Rhizophlyctis rosea]
MTGNIHIDEVLSNLPPALKGDISRIVSLCPEASPIFRRLYDYLTSNGLQHGALEPPNKKRKLESGEEVKNGGLDSLEAPLYTLQEVSIVSPFRKKLDVKFHPSGISLTNGKTQSTEYTLSRSTFAHLIRLPSPNKAKPHTTICVLSNTGDHLIFGYEEKGSNLRLVDHRSETTTTLDKDVNANEKILPAMAPVMTSGLTWLEPDSGVVNKKKHPFVNCYVKAKEGQLYFLTEGIFFGFKKPIIYIPHEDIEQLNIMNVTGRTFSFIITTSKGETHEFEMIAANEQDIVAAFMERCRILARQRQSQNGGEGAPAADEDDEEEDEDFTMESEDENSDLAEEYDSGHETDSQPSENGDEGSAEEGSDEEGDGDNEADSVDGDQDEGDVGMEEDHGIRAPKVSSKAMESALTAVSEALGMGEQTMDEGPSKIAEAPPPQPKLTGMKALAAQVERERLARAQGRK